MEMVLGKLSRLAVEPQQYYRFNRLNYLSGICYITIKKNHLLFKSIYFALAYLLFSRPRRT